MLDHGNTFLSLFSGCGGLDRAIPGRCVAHVEYEPFAQRVLRRHWPDVPVLGDVREVDGRAFRGVDLVIGGPPCQAASHAGLQLGESDPRWMWPEAVRIIRETEVPRFLLENVPGLMTLNGGRSFGAVLSALTALGYFVRWDHCTAAEVGRPHLRDRVWIVGTREPHGRGWCSVPIGQVKKWPRAGWAYEGYTGEDVPRWPKREVWPLVAAGVCPPPGMWPTPNAGGYNESESVEDWSARRARVKEEAGNGNGFGMPLGVASRLWPTPAVSDNNGAGAHGEGAMDLRTTARLWPSPTACMAKGSSDAARTRADGQDRTFDRLDHAVGDTAQGRLNPAWVESLLMGWPLGWTLPDGPSLADAPAPPRDVEIATRLTMDKAHRRDRLRLTGNGVVTETAALVYRTLLG
jgi:site-specific DNA-cytosine methylase